MGAQPHLARALGLTDRLELLIATGGMIEATTGTVATIIGAPIEIVALATTETEETTAATTEIEGMVIVARREGMIEATISGTIATVITMSAAVSAMGETSRREEVMTGERIGEVQKRRRPLIGMGRRREASRKLRLRRA